MSFALCAALTIIVFMYGYQVGKNQSPSEMCTTRSSAPVAYISAPTSRENLRSESGLPPCSANETKIFNHCLESSLNTDRMFLHIVPGTIPEDIFPELHHPGSPAKMSFVMSQEKDWPRKNAIKTMCNEVYLTRAGSRSNQPNKCTAIVKVPEGMASIVHSSHRIGFTALLTDQYRDDYPREETYTEETKLLPPLMLNLQVILADFIVKMGSPLNADGSRRAVIIMVANEGVMDLALNFICSAEAAGIDLATVAMFVGTQDDVELVENMGARAFYSPALGSMPTRAAGTYLDDTFSRMMWFKTTSVFLAVEAGFDVLFQDVDLVWMKDPIPYLKALDTDISFMDDGARTPRYTPFFVNSGFFFIKNNERTKYFQEKMFKNGAIEIARSHSHQSVLIKHLSEAHHIAGLKVLVLDKDLFPSGEAYHERKKYLATVIDRSFTPFVFHMCWTTNRHDKVLYFKELDLWYLPEDPLCLKGKIMHKLVKAVGSDGAAEAASSTSNIRNQCCQRQKYWKDKPK